MESEPARVWVIDLDAAEHGGGEFPADVRWLDTRERARAEALRDPTESRRYLAAHSALRILLSQATWTTPGDLRFLHERCTACGGDHGRPYLLGGPHFSLSRSGRWAAVALSHEQPVGVDLEARQAASTLEPLRDDLLAPGERSDDLLRTWVRKEALVKASGEGLNRSLATVPPDAGPVHDLELPPGLVGAIAGVTEFTLETQASTKVRQPMPARSFPESAE
ncbi:MAG: hypothetical protein JWP75_2257 [Frondihabitans sp.]|nr:hypothetical protein [Frondihabitans sp.]